jgi:polygalacturonase
MKKYIIVISSLLLSIHCWSIDYNILDFGASRDSTISSTKAINDAIETCHKEGGGKVIIPVGKFKSGTIILKDNVELHLENGAYLFASEDYNDFPILPRVEYRSLKDAGGWVSLIFAEGAKNISITGKGTIDGRGKSRKGRIPGLGGDLDGRPINILFISCRNISVSDIKLYNSAMWNQHYLDCEDVIVSNIKVYNHANGNNDGIDIDGCRRFILSNSIIDSDDDGIVLKSTGLAPCEDIIVSNCIVSSFANAIKCGTESTGGFKNISISDCIIRPSQHKGERIIKSTPSGITAISLEIVDGGVMDGVSINNILIEGTECPLYVRLANRRRKYTDEAPVSPLGKMRNIQISNIIAYNTGNFGSSITGIPDAKIENIYLSNIRFINRGGLKKGNFRNLNDEESRRHDLGADTYMDKYLTSFRDIVEDERGYPQPTVWCNLPSYGLFIRNVECIEVNNASFSSIGTEPRTPVIAVNVGNLQLKQINLKSILSPDIILSKVDRFDIDDKLKIEIEK